MNKKRIRIFINNCDEYDPKMPWGYPIYNTLRFIKKKPEYYSKKYY